MILDHTRFVLKQDLQDVWHCMVKDDERQAAIAKNLFNMSANW